MSRSKQINFTIPKDQLGVLAAFDTICSDQNVTRSELLLTLMSEHVQDAGIVIEPTKADDPPDIPAFLQ